jgi:hypothetical protein
MKIPFAQVEIELKKLYDDNISEPTKIEERLNLINEFIEACGWTTEEFIREMFNFDKYVNRKDLN